MQDFIKYKQRFQLEASKEENIEWAPDIPSILLGIIAGLFVAAISFKIVEYRAEQAELVTAPVIEDAQERSFVFDFYEALKNYEVLPRVRD